jgi:hypothetical protein
VPTNDADAKVMIVQSYEDTPSDPGISADGNDEGMLASEVDANASILEARADTVAAMYALCQEEISLGLYSKMSPISRIRVQAIKRELWDGFEALCKQGGVQPYPESLSSAAGCITSMFADVEPDEEEFGKMLLSEVSMM